MIAWRTDPWPLPAVMSDALGWIRNQATRNPNLIPRFIAMVNRPAAVRSTDQVRARLWLDLALMSDDPKLCVAALEAIEPHVPWDANTLDGRSRCYKLAGHALAADAAADLTRFLANEPVPLQVGIR